MAQQSVQLNVSQASSGAPIVVSMTYTSDGYLVTKSRDRLGDHEDYTIGMRMAAECRYELLDLVKKLVNEVALF